MKYIHNNMLSAYFDDDNAYDFLLMFAGIAEKNPIVIEPVRGRHETISGILAREYLEFCPTVKKTTLIYDRKSDTYLKILHHLTWKSKITSFLKNRAYKIWRLSNNLNAHSILVPKIRAYGIFRKGRRFFLIIDRIKGKSLFDILIREEKKLPVDICMKVIDSVAGLHGLGYWFGDSHLSHIYIDGSDVSGFIDLDSIRQNRFLHLRHLAKDIAGLDYPSLPLSKEEKKSLINYYMDKMNINDRDGFIKSVHYYSEKRWKKQAL